MFNKASLCKDLWLLALILLLPPMTAIAVSDSKYEIISDVNSGYKSVTKDITLRNIK